MIQEWKRKAGHNENKDFPVRLTVPGLLGILACLWILWPPPGAFARSSGTLAGARSVPDEVLDSMRGGFFFGDAGFNFAFRSVTWINNVLQTETDLTLANNIITSVNKTLNNAHVFPGSTVGTLNSGGSGGSAGVSGSGGGLAKSVSTATSSLIQVGSGNSVSGNSFSNSTGLSTVIQNNANNVVIQHLTQINGTVITGATATQSANMVYRFNQAATLGSIVSRF